ncbi:hypothetical protein LCGC14_0490360 [marine sediment metagenome]|uniref:Uncharacterized protein n=1 Tax=marine sediment metagenome TaxID=412755 RepID=A0A0F9S6Q6_9ZZZZ|nr:MAG: hypothetical protein Lokiarch_14240 [Candidatus Lokiarchaeum sp. GC14_75]
MKLRSTLLLIALIISGVGIAIYVGVFVFPYLNTGQEGPNINYIAPYVSRTHTCYTHASGCDAQFPNQLINYTVWNNDGTINITSSAITGGNGFFRLDLEINYSWTIRMQTIINSTIYTGTTNFSTISGSANCITTGQLKP